MPEARETAGALFQARQLGPAIAAASAEVRRSPGDLGARVLLAELLLFAGTTDRADVILDAAATADPTSAVVVAEFRQLLRAETARRQCSRDGRVPEFLGEPPAALRAALAAHVALRAGDFAEAARCAAEAEAVRPRVPGFIREALIKEGGGETAFDDFRDVDDLCAGFFEVLTTTGKYYWVPTERVASIVLHPPQRPRDLAWRRATISVNDGPDGEVYVPVIYDSPLPDGAPDLADDYRLGHGTEWSGDETGPVRGIGQRVFLAGDEDRGIMEIAELRFGT
jgi:type VI secretion system protein ImpE